MIFIYLRGGLGNQLFQLCFGITFAHKHNQDYQIVDHYYMGRGDALGDTPRHSYFDSLFQPLYSRHWLQVNLLKDSKTIDEWGYEIDRNYISINDDPNTHKIVAQKDQTVNGWFQEWRLIQPLISSFIPLLNIPFQAESNAVALHFRYGDYLTKYPHVYVAQSLNYYVKAIQQIPNVPGQIIYLFCSPSDWIKYVKTMKISLEKIFHRRTFIYKESESDVEDFIAMSQCSTIVTSNSTFSYWSALVSEYYHDRDSCLIFRPAKWYQPTYVHAQDVNQLCPPHWHVIE